MEWQQKLTSLITMYNITNLHHSSSSKLDLHYLGVSVLMGWWFIKSAVNNLDAQMCLQLCDASTTKLQARYRQDIQSYLRSGTWGRVLL